MPAGPRCAVVAVALACALGGSAVVAAAHAAHAAHAAPAAAGTPPSARPASWSPVAGLPRLPPWRALYETARRRHVLWGDAAFPLSDDEATRDAVDGAAGSVALAPLLVPPALVRETLEVATPSDDDLAAAILASRRASLAYRGLAGLDEPTLAALVASPGLVKRLAECCSDTFAAFGGRLRVRDGRVVVPGGEAAWEKLVGEPASAPAAFLPALLGARGGRRAALHDALARLDSARLQFALGPAGPGRTARLQALAGVFDREPVWWGREARGYGRDDADAARVLVLVRIDAGGDPSPPRTVAFWQAVFDGVSAPSAPTWPGRVAASRAIDAAWAAEAIGRGPAEARLARLAQLCFGQRVFGEAADESLVETVNAVKAFADRPALVLALERMGLRDPRLFAAAADAAAAARNPLLLQAALGVVERARFARTTDVRATEGLVRSLVALPWGDAAAIGPAVAEWCARGLVPVLREAVGGAREVAPGAGAEVSVEDAVLRAMAGAREGAAAPIVEWEGVRYRADPAGAELARLRRVRSRQGGERLDDALARCGAPTLSGAAADAPAGSGAAAGASPNRRGAVAGSKGESCTGRLAATLAALVYAAHLGEPDGPALAGEDASRRHESGLHPWGMPEQSRDGKGAWHVHGALLGLDEALAPFAARRPQGDELPEAAPLVAPEPRRRLAAAAVRLDAFDLRDEDRDAIASALARGRARVSALAAGSADLEAVAAAAALDPWRASALRWVLDRDPGARLAFFSRVELLALGTDGGRADWAAPWGGGDPVVAGLRPAPPVPRPADESAGRAPERAVVEGFADLHLRVAEFLAERRLPACLAPALVLRLLLWLADEARPVGADDRFALEDWVRKLAPERIEDAVASLADGGPLLPVGKEKR